MWPLLLWFLHQRPLSLAQLRSLAFMLAWLSMPQNPQEKHSAALILTVCMWVCWGGCYIGRARTLAPALVPSQDIVVQVLCRSRHSVFSRFFCHGKHFPRSVSPQLKITAKVRVVIGRYQTEIPDAILYTDKINSLKQF